ncbi:bifunctional phosphoribosylaminoimidazolecarboxamide formyltransferase/IMP cyclohydrolase [Amnibacterium kyonggiense]|uniref:Bifunctional purine biosynthesis protein PurH n=1 Tax=Amnibacterium kyonggiense TaxID=595671 RepID=A0A4R7FR54_9MICO|nr:bifunctional phosphoribosylaminoimidazolecarboxamide formyltransferase/IMP cyclohydrolase [Amnibacterium kyonggiense]TDS80206.1 phosphoribosylaminoimidazolecarboxamide formyltransferase/IMP cyclohydrolase [Amnibacterium kyonggiense]
MTIARIVEAGSPDVIPVRRALLSVSDKHGLVELGAALVAAGVELVSTGSTASTLRGAGLAVTDVAAVTGFPESLDGRVKTLHPAVHGGLLADLRREQHAAELTDLGIEPFELVVSSLYPFERTVASGADDEAIVEQIDIGGPAMVRAAAKNFANVAVVTGVDAYPVVLEAIAHGGIGLDLRRRLAAHAFERIAAYDRAIADWFAGGADASVVTGSYRFVETPLRYGENAHQSAALWREPGGHGLAQAVQLNGKELSYNNMVDADAAVRAALDFDEPAVAVMKHANPCGIAVAPAHAVDPIAAAHRLANDCDPVSAFGGVIAANRTVTLGMAEAVAGIFTEVIVAPAFESEAVTVLKQRKSLRILELPEGFERPSREFKQVSGGVLVQDPDRYTVVDPATWTLAAGAPADDETLADLAFAWRAVRSVKSNAILLASGGASVGIGMGQVNRVDSCQLAVTRAGERAAGSVAASDAFFPFADGVEVLLRAGVKAVVQPGGSVRDPEVVAAVEAAGVTMYFTGERHFFH